MGALSIFDVQGVEKGWDWVAGMGYLIRPEHIAQPSAFGFRLVELHETHGAATAVVYVQAAGGSPYADLQGAARWWEGMPHEGQGILELPGDMQTCPGPATRWALVQMLEGGQTGFGVGSGDVYKASMANYLSVPTNLYPSARVNGVGWKGDTNHNGMLGFVFRLAEPDEAPPPPPPPPTAGTVAALLAAADEKLVAAQLQAVGAQADLAAIRALLGVGA